MKTKKMLMEYMSLWSEMHKTVVTPVLAESYWRVFKKFSDEDCYEAFEKCTEECEWFPKIPHIKKNIPSLIAGNDAALKAWVEIGNAARLIGNYSSVKFKDPVIHSVVKAMGGWSELSTCTNEQWTWKKKEFEELYPVMAARGDHDQYLIGDKRLSDICDRIKSVDEACVNDDYTMVAPLLTGAASVNSIGAERNRKLLTGGSENDRSKNTKEKKTDAARGLF